MGTPLQPALERARSDPGLVVLEGVHALKHAVRFGARVQRIASVDPDGLRDLLDTLAPDVVLPVDVEPVATRQWQAITQGGLPSPAVAIAVRPDDDLDRVVATATGRPVVALVDPTHLGNVGAVVRVAAAADAAGVMVVGGADPWHRKAVRGGAGLQFALPVGRRDVVPDTTRPLVAVDPDGDDITVTQVPGGALLAFGTERAGLPGDLLARADLRVCLPMRPGVSSLNLATAVAATLYVR